MDNKSRYERSKNQFGNSCLRRQSICFSKAGATDKLDVYDLDADTWESAVMPGTSTILGAVCVDNRIFVLKEEGGGHILGRVSSGR